MHLIQQCTLKLLFLLCTLLCVPSNSYSQSSPLDLPLIHLNDFQYQGAFRLPASDYGQSDLNYSQGPIQYNAQNHSLFIVGHSHQQAIAEFAIPALSTSTSLGDLNMSGAPLQNFSSVIDRVSGGNPQSINRIGGMQLVARPGGVELLVNGYEYYDAPGDNSHTTFVLRDSSNLSTATVNGFFKLTGAAHTSGWISPIPSEWQSILGGKYISGNSSGIPIIGRTSVGPSAFVFDPLQIVGTNSTPDPVPTTKLLDFSLGNPLHNDLSNSSRTNDIWTHLSRATYGFIAPGTRTYVTIGYSGGHASGVCYKCTQNNGNLCGGYCAADHTDYYHYYWLWDVADLLKVKNGEIQAHSVRPYQYGILPTPFSTSEIGGGTFDPISGLLYLTVQRADNQQGQYSNPPVVVAYRFDPDTPEPKRRTPADFDGDNKSDFSVIRPGPSATWFTFYSKTQTISSSNWGLSTYDLFLDLDFNADGWCDQNATRARANAAFLGWYTKLSPHYTIDTKHWGESGDIPVVADFDGDGASEQTIFRPRDGTWWIVQSKEGFLSKQWGLAGDLPTPEDYDGDGYDDFAIWRPSLGMWAVSFSSKNYSTSLADILWTQWGLPGDHPMTGDYDGDEKADLVVWRNSDGAWYVCNSSSNFQCSTGYTRVQFGLPGDIPIKADFDGDKILDFAVWRPSNGTWYWRQSSDASIHSKQWGLPGDFPLGTDIKTMVGLIP